MYIFCLITKRISPFDLFSKQILIIFSRRSTPNIKLDVPKKRWIMKRRGKLIFSLVSLCFSIAVLCFGVYSALSVSYSINGSVSYEINDVFVELDLSVYRALSTTPVNSATHNQNVSTIKEAGNNISETDFGKLSYTDHKSTYENGVVTNPGQEWSTSSSGLDLTYGSPTEDNQGYAFYIVIDIHNLGSEIINAQITAPTSLENTILQDSGNVEITADGTERIVLGLALDDVTKGITSADFTYTITISRGELPIEPITDMTFTVDEENKTATLTSYIGSGGDVTIPESIGYASPSSMTLTFNTMEDMTSNEMNMMYFYQDLYIKLPNQEERIIENPLLWFYENMATIQATPEDYFPMTIQTVESYEINQDDYNQYADFGQDMAMTVPIMPIIMIIEGLLYNSVDVQFGTEGRSFTFNMENYNAAMAGDESQTSEAIRDFMSKAESDLGSVLPVTYSNLKYSKVFEGDEYTVTSIGSDAFSSYSSLTSIDIPSSVKSIGENAFQYCNKLENITVDPNNANYCSDEYGVLFNKDKTELIQYPIGNTRTQYTIPSNVTSIGSDAFYRCDALETVTFGANSQLASIGEGAFNNCDALEKVNITDIDAWAMIDFGSYNANPSYYGDLYLNGELVREVTLTTATKIGDYAFYGYDSLTSITIPSSVTSIGKYAFSNCDALKTVTFGDNSQLESIGSYAFYYCSNLTSIDIPSSVTSIGEEAFYYCSNLTSIEIPSSVTSIGDWAFYNCSALEKVNITDIDAWAMIDFGSDYSNPLYYGDLYLNGELVTKVTLSTATKIEDYAFYSYGLVTSITIPSGVTSIGEEAFWYCSALETVTFGDNSQLASIGSSAFYFCLNLTSIEIPSSVTSIGEDAFYNCGDLEKVNITDIDAWAMIDFGNNNPLYDGVGLYLNGELVTEVTLTTATKITDRAFFGYDLLTSITIPSSVTSLGEYAFSGCSALETVSFEDNSQLESIGERTFSYCSNLTSIEIPSSVTSIGSSAFSGTPWLTNLQNTSYGIATASDGQTRFVIEVPTDITDDELDMTNVKVIADYAFSDCYALTSIEIPSSVTSIGDNAFRDCYALAEVYNYSTYIPEVALGNSSYNTNGYLGQY